MERSEQIEWCIAQLESDANWWIVEASWLPFLDGEERLSILDPKQVEYMFDLLEPLKEYGLQKEIVERAFFRFSIDKDLSDVQIRLIPADEGFESSDEKLFALPNTFMKGKGSYGEFLDHISILRVKMLNAISKFSQKLTVDELEDAVREVVDSTQIRELPIHLFHEILAVLEYCPLGFHDPDDIDDVDDDTLDGARRLRGEWNMLERDSLDEIEEVSENINL
jgi:hypothetical protein